MRQISYLIICLCFFQEFAMAGPRIVNGQDATAGDWPWMVVLVHQVGKSLKDRQFCGGTLIHPSWVLTAGHCMEEETIYSFKVVTGITNLKTEEGVEMDVEEIIRHPDYKNENDSVPPIADLALLKLAQPATQPTIAIADPYSLLTEAGTLATVLGWGKLRESGNLYPDHLQQTEVPLVSNEICNSPQSFNGDVQADKLCAGFIEGGTDACEGDSGGPLVVFDDSDGHWKQIGIVSFGDGCARPFLYGVYTRVASFQEFITQHLCADETPLSSPQLQVDVMGQQATASWNAVASAGHYQLYYAPYSNPLNETTLNHIHSFSTGSKIRYTTDLPVNSEYYVAIRAYRGNCHSNFSNLSSLLVY